MEHEDGELFTIQPENIHSVDLSDYKVYREIDRMKGLLRFTPNKHGELIARCATDNYILPALISHFTARFGDEISWSIIDEKRALCLRKQIGKNAEIIPFSPSILNAVLNEETGVSPEENDEWEELWKHYHRTINNEDRNNPKCQKQFMPKRYWKYLPEM
ncbi:MAG: TIGR03915 family putative DNA repair protein [Treponema sp.]|nr:TIGR03915 family putative DNA repair protein [Treponema sp.]